MKPRFFQHPQALVDAGAEAIGEGTRIWAFAHVMGGARIGRNCNIGDHCFIESGARIGRGVTIKNGVSIWDGLDIRDYVFIGPNAAFTNDLDPRSPRFGPVAERYKTQSWIKRTVIEEGASIGANATVLCGITIGRFALIGAGAVVTREVPPHALMVGVPAELRGHVCQCGATLRVRGRVGRCARCGAEYKLARGQVAAKR